MNDERPYTPIIGAIVVGLLVGFFLGTQVMWGRPIEKKEIVKQETKCDKSQLMIDAEAANILCRSSRVVGLEYTDNGKGEKTTPLVRCKD